MNRQILSKALPVILAFSFGLYGSLMVGPFRVGAIPPTKKPDLIATKTNDLGGGNAIVGTPFHWIIKIENIGDATATFKKDEVILEDNMPSDGVDSYGAVSISTSAGITGGDKIECQRHGTKNKDLICKVKSATVTIPIGEYIEFTVQVTPNKVKTLTNPTGEGSHCKVDFNDKVDESNENNNNCSNSVTVVSAPVCGNGTIETGEQCDDGTRNGTTCTPSYGSTCNYCSTDCQTITLTGPYCGDHIINNSEQCEDPNTSNNTYCSQSTTQCASGNKTQTRDAYGNCNATCGCTYDNWGTATCVKDSCGATCSNDADCNDQNPLTTDSCNQDTCQCQHLSVPLMTINASKIICDNEADLPNWGTGGPNITVNTASDWVAQHSSCHLVPNWGFEWAYDGVANPGDTLYGPAGFPWHLFNVNSPAQITDLQGKTKILVREVLENGYIPFTYGPQGNKNTDDYSAELYCHTDVLNYDNYDYINNPQLGNTYYCVGFNTPIRYECNRETWQCTPSKTGQYPNEDACKDACKPVCGDGKVEGTETCDPPSTAAPGPEDTSFCDQNCNSVPIYHSLAGCPNGQHLSLINSYQIDSANTSGVIIPLSGSNTYKFEAKGTFYPTRNQNFQSDAAYTTEDGWSTVSNKYGIYGIPPDLAAHALLSDFGQKMGIVNWGQYNSDHNYSFYFAPTSTSATFVIGDRYDNWFKTDWNNNAGMTDNSGSLTLDVYECVPNQPNPSSCGNGTIEPGEECDGTAGVTRGKNFCTDTCRLIPIYDGGHSCPEGTVMGKTPVKSIDISSKKVDGEIVSLQPGTYLFHASGTYQYSSNANSQADAGYGTSDSWTNLRSDLGITEGAIHRGVLSLLSDMGTGKMGIVDWGSYNDNHIYSKAYQITGDNPTNVSFVISDWYDSWYNSYQNQSAMDDNSGSLHLDIYKCVTPPSLTVCKYEDKGSVGTYESGTDTPLSGWQIRVDYRNGTTTTNYYTTKDDGCITLSDLPFGLYSVSEVLQDGWTKTYPENAYSITIDAEHTSFDPLIFLNFRSSGGVTTATTVPPTGGGGAPITGTVIPTGGVVAGATTGGGVVAGATTVKCEPYLLSYIKLGGDNDPEEVKKLESFLNEFLGLDLPIDGIYDLNDFNAVKQFQLLMKDKVLAPWVEIGCLPNVDTPTGYVYKTTIWAINSFFCSEEKTELPKPDLSNEICHGYGLEGIVGQAPTGQGQVLGEEVAKEGETATTETPPETTPEETPPTTTEGETQVTTAKSQDWLWAILILAILGGAGYFLFFKKK